MRIAHRATDIGPASSSGGLEAGGQITAADAMLFALIFPVGLYLDRTVEFAVQATGSVLVWIVLLRFLHRARGDLRVIIIACLAWSTFGEVFASLIWGLYRYRLYNVPMFVPPGHVLMLLLALFLAERLRGALVAVAGVTAFAYAVYALSTSKDVISVILTPIFITCLIVGGKRQIYAATFLLAIALELYGTWLGNWRWQSAAPWIDVSMANPPICIGALYCARDAISGITLGWVRGRQRRSHERQIAEQPAALSARPGTA
jgi:hypothetical protein